MAIIPACFSRVNSFALKMLMYSVLIVNFPVLALSADEEKAKVAKPDPAVLVAKEKDKYAAGLKQIEDKFYSEHIVPALGIYGKALDILIGQIEKANNPDLLAAAQKEKTRLESEKNVPDPYPKGLALSIREIQYKYHKFVQLQKFECYSAKELHMQNYYKRMNSMVDILLQHNHVQIAAGLEEEMKKFKDEIAKMTAAKNAVKALAPPKYEPPAFVSKRHNLYPSVEKNLVAYYSFDADEGTTVVDKSSNKNNAILHGATLSKDGRFGSCYQFGGDQYIDADKLLIRKSSSWAFSAWVKNTSMNSEGMVLFNGDYPNDGFGLNWFKGCWLVLYGGSGQHNGGFGKVKEWQHVIVTCSDGKIKFYVDGRLAKSLESRFGDPTGRTIIGSCVFRGKISGEWFKGSIDEVMIFNKGLTPREASIVYECQGGEPVPEEEKEKPETDKSKAPVQSKGLRKPGK